MVRVYGDLIAEIMKNELDIKLVYFYKDIISPMRYNPILILSNKLEIEKLRNYLNEVLENYDK